jgi:NAD(P)-dependent dehydrogenase (short-subunit alcohol dehydrogenase family)
VHLAAERCFAAGSNVHPAPKQARRDEVALLGPLKGSSAVENRIALVTGANKGIGLEVARQLANAGCTVWLGARDAERGEAAERALKAQGVVVHFQPLDVTSEESVTTAVKRIKIESERLDILINNAGVAFDSNIAPSQVGMDMIRSTFEVNFFGCIRVTQAFLPLLRKSAAARIVMVSSDIGSHAHQSNPAYPYYTLNPMAYISSKAALNAVTIALAKELRQNNIKVNSANPGFTATDLNGHRGILTVEQGATPIVRLATLSNDGPSGEFFGPNGPEPW